MNMGGLYRQERSRNTRKEQMGESEKRERKYFKMSFIAVVSWTFHRFTLSMYVGEGEEVSTANSKACDLIREVSTAPQQSHALLCNSLLGIMMARLPF